MHIFIDESGDLGFSKTSSRLFLFTAIITDNRRIPEKIVQKVWKNLRKKHKKLGELHAYNADDSTRRKILKIIAKNNDINIAYGLTEKSTLPIKLRKDREYLYAQILCRFIVRLHDSGIWENSDQAQFHIDRKYVDLRSVNKLKEHISDKMKNNGYENFSVIIESSHKDKSLQAADFVSWAIFRKIERNDGSFFEIIKDRVVEIKIMSP